MSWSEFVFKCYHRGKNSNRLEMYYEFYSLCFILDGVVFKESFVVK